GRKLAHQLGIEPRRLGLIGKLTSGIVRALFVLIILALAVGRWEVAAADLFEAIKGVALGIRIGDFTISFGAVFGAIVLFLIVVGLTRLVQAWLEKEVMPHTAFEPSRQPSIVPILGYVGFIVAIGGAPGPPRLVRAWLEKEVMPPPACEPSLQLSIVTILGYVGFIVAIVVALGELGI